MFDPLFSSNKISIYSQINITLFELEDCIICSDILGGGNSFYFPFFKMFFTILLHILNQILSQLILTGNMSF